MKNSKQFANDVVIVLSVFIIMVIFGAVMFS
jgi:hypothetical protein